MDFTFTAIGQPPPPQKPPEPPEGQQLHNNKFDAGANKVSFRDKVLGTRPFVAREKVDLIANKMAQIELVQGNRLMPMLHVEQKIMEDLVVPWKDALVVKLLGKNLGYNIMKNKLKNVWKLMGGIELMDVGSAFYMVKFDGEDDKNKVINGGPWMIYDHYLAVRQWTPNFNASTTKIDKTMVWIRIPSLNLAFYDESVLWAIASMVGNPIKVYLHTLKVARGRFARMCVEVDLIKPVVGSVGINGEWYHEPNEPGQKTSEPGQNISEPTEKEPLGEPGINGQNTTVENAINGEKIVIMDNNDLPDSLHGDWKKRNNKSKNHGNNELFKGDKSQPQYAKYGFPNMESYENMRNMIQNEDKDPLIGPNQKAITRFKKKRLCQEISNIVKSGPSKFSNDPIKNKDVAKQSQHGGKVHNKFGQSVNNKLYANHNVDQSDQKKAENFDLADTCMGDTHSNRCIEVEMETGVKEKDMDPWLLTVVYASPRENERSETWHQIRQLATTITDPWLMMGDFNEIASPDEKKRGSASRYQKMDRVFKKLDRVLCNVSWRLRFHEGFAKVLPRVQSDHHPIIVISDGETNMGRNRPFRRKKELLARLNGIQNSSNYGYSNFLETLENELQQQLTTTLYQEECLWYQKSRGKWITDGDRNTKYYHSKTIVRRRRNKIVSLRSETGDWIEDQEILINMAMNFYINLYHEDKPVRDPVVSWTTYPQNLETEHHKLSSAVQYVECKQALFDMGPHKAPGADGYPALFFQQNWDIVAESVHHFVNQVWSNPSLISLINNNLLVLIPKVDKLEFIAQFRLIALWRTIHHNIIVAQEMVHSMAKMKVSD
ncbi:hypothetical protein TSUD_238250 [Trifolium subterraneum]|uniref:DUF4283 domain-containing protein n=1 Tax=Trifolium subterraneum TaxID=3900 RepID=A0A2Z6NKX8_TRISU|nr:hypothetical protein TSUD_238250 [Trifolium subterraneum]